MSWDRQSFIFYDSDFLSIFSPIGLPVLPPVYTVFHATSHIVLFPYKFVLPFIEGVTFLFSHLNQFGLLEFLQYLVTRPGVSANMTSINIWELASHFQFLPYAKCSTIASFLSNVAYLYSNYNNWLYYPSGSAHLYHMFLYVQSVFLLGILAIVLTGGLAGIFLALYGLMSCLPLLLLFKFLYYLVGVIGLVFILFAAQVLGLNATEYALIADILANTAPSWSPAITFFASLGTMIGGYYTVASCPPSSDAAHYALNMVGCTLSGLITALLGGLASKGFNAWISHISVGLGLTIVIGMISVIAGIWTYQTGWWDLDSLGRGFTVFQAVFTITAVIGTYLLFFFLNCEIVVNLLIRC